MRIALIVIDMQKCFLSEYSDTRAISECCEYINYTGKLLRESGHIVIHVKDVEEAGQVSEAELDFTDELKIDPADLSVEKIHSNAFWKTSLDDLLRDQGVDLLVLCGQAAEHCVVFTYNGAVERGHRATILQNGVLSQRPGRVAALMEDRSTLSYPAIDALISVGQKK